MEKNNRFNISRQPIRNVLNMMEFLQSLNYCTEILV